VSKKEEDAAPVIIMGGPPKKDSNESFLSKVGKALTLESGDGGGSSASKAQYRCDGRTRCSQMTSCEEATFFLRNCPDTKMDGNGDGVPCERQWCH